MEASILSQLFAAALAISQVTVDPANVKTHFDPQADQAQVIQILQAGCKSSLESVLKELGFSFSVAETGFDEAIGLIIGNSKTLGVGLGIKEGLNLDALHAGFKLFCKGENVSHPEIKLSEIIAFYNTSLENLPDHTPLKGMKLPQSTTILDVYGERFTEVYKDDNRRRWVPIAQIPPIVQQAFIAAEDNRFFEHKGIDIYGIGRAFMNNTKAEGQNKRPEGGSTITQQVVKNLLVGDEVSSTRKIREIVIASRVEQLLSKQEILELYLNYVFLGRASWGVEMASQSYFGKSVTQINSPLEAALLAGMPKGPKLYNPDVFPDRSQGRTAWVLSRMLKKGFIQQADYDKARADVPTMKLVTFEAPSSRRSFYFLDDILSGTAKGLGIKSLSDDSYVVKSTIHPKIQPLVEASLQEGLAQYEITHNRVKWRGPDKNVQVQINQFAAENPDQDAGTAWHKVLLQTRPTLYDVHWPIGIVVETGKNKVTVGVKDGRLLPLKAWNSQVLRSLKIGDIVYVQITEGSEAEGKKKAVAASASLRAPPEVQGAVVVLENRSGRVLGLTGGFSYVQSQYNRAVDMLRQPGSTVKPLTYLVALQSGISPNHYVPDVGVSFQPIIRGRGARAWGVGPGSGRELSVRQGLERSNNQVTARLLYEMGNPVQALDAIRNLCKEIRLCQTREPLRYYPFIIGAQEVRLIDLASFYATIANDGVRAAPFFVESIVQNGQEIFSMQGENFKNNLTQIQSVQADTFREVKSMLQGVLVRGTARKLADLAPYVGGKTGTTNLSRDTWFVGFTNDLTIAVWVGYDNVKRSLGVDSNRVTLPIFESIVRQSFSASVYKEASLLNAPHPEMAVAQAEPSPAPRDNRYDRYQRYEDDEDDRYGDWWPEYEDNYDRRTRRPYYSPPPEDMDEYRNRRQPSRRDRGWDNWGSWFWGR